MSAVKSNTRLEEALSKIESLREILGRLEQVTKTIDELVGEVSFLQILEDEIQEEKPYCENGRLGITGTNTSISWSFEEIAAAWRDVYADEHPVEAKHAMEGFAAGFRKLAKMFDEEARRFHEKALESETLI